MSEQLFAKIRSKLALNSSLLTDKTSLSYYLKGTEGLHFFTDKQRSLFAVITITTTEEVNTLLALANKYANDDDFGFSLYPVSTGKNWGYGTSQPPGLSKRIILLDLSKLTQISFFDEELGLITVEPGVTQQQLSDYLIALGDHYMVPVTGAGPDCSILANALERGYGITPYTDHFSAVNSIQGVWGNGLAYQSAIHALDQSPEKLVDKTFKWGLGPYLDGLFTQSNFGIVTKVTLRLAKKKPAFTSFFIQLNDDKLLEKIIPLIRNILQTYEGIVGSINLMDQRRILSMFTKNPNGNATLQVMTDLDIAKLSKTQQTPCWTVVGSIYGSKKVVKAVKSEINTLFKSLPCKRVYSNSPVIIIANKIINLLPRWLIKQFSLLTMVNQQLDSFNKGKEIMLGKPNKVALKLAYWRNKSANNMTNSSLSPSQDGCGLLWYAPLIPMKADKMREYVTFIRETCPKFNIEPFITFTNLRHDCVDSTIPIVFDLTNPEAVKDAHNCLKALVTDGLKKGFVPYRLNIDQQQWLLDKNNDFWIVVDQLKQTLDGNNILSQGRYNPR